MNSHKLIYMAFFCAYLTQISNILQIFGAINCKSNISNVVVVSIWTWSVNSNQTKNPECVWKVFNKMTNMKMLLKIAHTQY